MSQRLPNDGRNSNFASNQTSTITSSEANIQKCTALIIHEILNTVESQNEPEETTSDKTNKTTILFQQLNMLSDILTTIKNLNILNYLTGEEIHNVVCPLTGKSLLCEPSFEEVYTTSKSIQDFIKLVDTPGESNIQHDGYARQTSEVIKRLGNLHRDIIKKTAEQVEQKTGMGSKEPTENQGNMNDKNIQAFLEEMKNVEDYFDSQQNNRSVKEPSSVPSETIKSPNPVNENEQLLSSLEQEDLLKVQVYAKQNTLQQVRFATIKKLHQYRNLYDEERAAASYLDNLQIPIDTIPIPRNAPASLVHQENEPRCFSDMKSVSIDNIDKDVTKGPVYTKNQPQNLLKSDNISIPAGDFLETLKSDILVEYSSASTSKIDHVNVLASIGDNLKVDIGNINYASVPTSNIDYSSVNASNIGQINVLAGNMSQKSLPSSSIKQKSISTSRIYQRSLPTSSMCQTSEPTSSMCQRSEPTSSMCQRSKPTSSMCQTSVPTSSMHQTSVPSNSMHQTSVPSSSMHQTSVPTSSAYQTSVPSSSMHQTSVPTSSAYQTSVPTSSMFQASSIHQKIVPTSSISQASVTATNTYHTSVPPSNIDRNNISPGNLPCGSPSHSGKKRSHTDTTNTSETQQKIDFTDEMRVKKIVKNFFEQTSDIPNQNETMKHLTTDISPEDFQESIQVTMDEIMGNEPYISSRGQQLRRVLNNIVSSTILPPKDSSAALKDLDKLHYMANLLLDMSTHVQVNVRDLHQKAINISGTIEHFSKELLKLKDLPSCKLLLNRKEENSSIDVFEFGNSILSALNTLKQLMNNLFVEYDAFRLVLQRDCAKLLLIPLETYVTESKYQSVLSLIFVAGYRILSRLSKSNLLTFQKNVNEHRSKIADHLNEFKAVVCLLEQQMELDK